MIPGTRPRLIVTRLPPQRIVRLGPDHWFVDFGRAVFGTVELALASISEPGRVLVHLGERCDGADRVDRNPPGSVRYRCAPLVRDALRNCYRAAIPADPRNTCSRAVLMPPEIGEVLPFRYCKLENLPCEIRPEDIRQCFVHAPFNDDAASFESSHPILNEVWDLCRHTIKATTFCGLYVDGDRERIPYEGDAYINQLSHYALDADYQIGRATLEYLMAHPTWPTDWQLHVPLMAWADLLYSGDDSFVRTHYDLLKHKTLIDLAGPDGLISGRNREAADRLKDALGFDAFFGDQVLTDLIDWPRPGGFHPDTLGETDGYVIDAVNTAINALHHRALVVMGRIASVIGRHEDAAFFQERAARVAATMNRELFDPGRGVYVDGPGTDHASLHANAFSLMAGLVPESRRASVSEHVCSRGMACSVYGAQHLLDGLYRSGRADHALELLTATHDRSWHHMIHGVGSTMTLEAWDPKYKPNLDWNHAWGCAPTNVIIRRLMGVRPASPGFANVIIEPRLGGLEWAKARIPTPLGPIEIEATARQGTHPEISLSVPDAMHATLAAPPR